MVVRKGSPDPFGSWPRDGTEIVMARTSHARIDIHRLRRWFTGQVLGLDVYGGKSGGMARPH